MERWQVGDITITKITELEAWFPIEGWAELIPDCTVAAVDEVDWLRPTYRDGDAIKISVHSLLLDAPDRKVVVDVGVGNAKARGWAVADQLDTDFLERFEQVWPREQVEAVVYTHLHTDHVGWNTTLVDGTWTPTFPNARHCIVREELDYWLSYQNDATVSGALTEYAQQILDGPETYRDSLEPVLNAGLVDWVKPGDSIASGITLVDTAGHTPGHVSILVESGGDSAVITGDIFHSVAQVERADWTTIMDTTPSEAADARHTFLDRYADTDTLVIASHFGTPSGGYLRRDGSSYRLEPVTAD